MARFTSQQIQDHYKKAPEELKEAVLGVATADKIFEIGRHFGITIEKNGFLAEEIGYIILGLARPEEFVKNIEERLELDQKEASEIAASINKEIFYQIRETMKRAYQFEMTLGEPVSSPAQKPSFAKISQELREEVKKEFPTEEKSRIRPQNLAMSPQPTTAVEKKETGGAPKVPEAKSAPLSPPTTPTDERKIPSGVEKTTELKPFTPAAPAFSTKLAEPEKKTAAELFTKKLISRDSLATKMEEKPIVRPSADKKEETIKPKEPAEEARPGEIQLPKLEQKRFIPPPPRPFPHQQEGRQPIASVVRPVTEEKKMPTPPPASPPPPPEPPSRKEPEPQKQLPATPTFGIADTRPPMRIPKPPTPLTFPEPKTDDLVRASGAGALPIAEIPIPPRLRPPLPPDSLPTTESIDSATPPIRPGEIPEKNPQPQTPTYVKKDPYREPVD